MRTTQARATQRVARADRCQLNDTTTRRTTLEIYARVQKRVSRRNVHAAFDELLNGGDRDTVYALSTV